MGRGRVLVIDGDEGVASSLAAVLTEHGYEVTTRADAQSGYRAALETRPLCVLCNPVLPDIDGAWVARKIRTEASVVAKVPILFVGDVIDQSVRVQGLGVGVDVFLTRPGISVDELTAQVDAMVAMARRFEGDEQAPASTAAAIRGDLSMFPLASLLMMFEMERRSGTVLVVAQSGRRATLTVTDGLFSTTDIGGVPKPALEVLREVLSWRSGRFAFAPRQSSSLPPPRASVGALVLEAMRLEDEEKEMAQELPADDLEDAARDSIEPSIVVEFDEPQ